MEGLDRWKLVRPLGAGAFGQVHLAWDTVDRRWVALKQFTGQDELGLLRFVIESRIRVEHPHLVSTLAFRLVDDQAWLVTELARGGSLRQLMTRGPLPAGWVAELVDQGLDALSALHATGVVHRDIKPANLLLRDAGAVRPHLLVGDFGIAAWRTVSMTGVGAAIGTPGYLAPEYLDGTPPSAQTDLFALGVLAAELLSGRRLVHHSNAMGALPADWTGPIPLPDGLPPHLANVLRRMADPDPSRRYPDCTEAREALRFASPPGGRRDLTAVEAVDLLAGLPAQLPPSGPTTRPPTPTPTPPRPTRFVTAPPPPAVPEWTVQLPPRAQVAAPPTRRPRRIKDPRPVAVGAALVALTIVALIVWLAQAPDPAGPPGSEASAGTSTATAVAVPEWTPVRVEACSRVDIGRKRQNETQRCQRFESGQAWVLAPQSGFPPRSNPAGPFPRETCTQDNGIEYTPTGSQLVCQGGAWQLRSGS